MLKSTFFKYLVTFVIIILLSFFLLSGIITTMIRSYFTEEKENRLVNTASILAGTFESLQSEDIGASEGFHIFASGMLSPVINNDTELDVLLTDSDGKIILSTVNAGVDEKGFRKLRFWEALGTVDVSLFTKTEVNDNGVANFHRGDLDGLLNESSIACLEEITVSGEVSGYVVAVYSTAKEDVFIITTRRAVISSSVWVMLASVIAVYFITQRITRPLHNMTVAAKKFGKGDFSYRVPVYGSDEVSELSEAFNNMAESLEKLDKMRSSFLASVSHDLRTPMTTIAGFIDGIMSGAIPPEKQGDYLQIISAEVHRLSRLVSQLLDVSRLESGDRKMNFENFDVAEVARIILISFEQKIDEKKLDVDFDTDDEAMSVFADKDAIHQVLYNLCHNAIKFAKEGGKFVIKIKYAESNRIKVFVFDEGQGIAEEDKSMVFERFYKTDSSRGLDKNGVGLGLYICKTIIDAHGEKIGVESVVDESTEFWFTLKKAK